LALRLPRAIAGAAASLISTRARLSLAVRDGRPDGQGRLAGVSLVSPGVGLSPLPPSLLVVVDNAVVLVAPELSVGGGWVLNVFIGVVYAVSVCTKSDCRCKCVWRLTRGQDDTHAIGPFFNKCSLFEAYACHCAAPRLATTSSRTMTVC
jgi:hypothetical protein